MKGKSVRGQSDCSLRSSYTLTSDVGDIVDDGAVLKKAVGNEDGKRQ